MKDVFKGAGYTVLVVALGWVLGACVTHYLFTESERPIWYCIDGKVYEKAGDYYSTVVPARTCLLIDTD